MNPHIKFFVPRTSAQATAPRQLVVQASQAERQEWLLDQALAETFPASDPISPSCIS
jgi:hypothetical protein